MATNNNDTGTDEVKTEDIGFEEVDRSGEFDTLNNEKVIAAPMPKSEGITGDLSGAIPAAHHDESYVEPDEEVKIKPGTPPPPGSQKGAPPEENKSFNPGFDDMPENQQDDSALLTATAFVDAYAEAKMIFPTLIAISERKLKKLDKAGEIDLEMLIRVSRTSTQQITLLAYVKQFNEKITTPFKTSEEFKENVIPLLAEILKKKGIALSPEQLLMYYVGMDMMGTIKAAVIAAGERREMLDNLKELTEMNRAFAASVKPTTADVPGQAVPPQQTAPTDTATVVSNIVDEALAKDKPQKRKPGRPVGSKKVK